MATITEEQRKKEMQNDRKFQSGIPKMEDYREQDLAEMLTIKQRLMRRLEKNTIQVPFEDDLGTFSIEIRLMSPKEQTEIMKLYANLSNYLKVNPDKKDTEKTEELLTQGQDLLSELYRMAGYLCVDPDLNAEYWKKGEGFNIDVPLKLIQAAVSESQKVQKQVQKFRKN